MDSKEAIVGYLGPIATFSHEALLSQTDLANARLEPYRSITDVLEAVDQHRVDLGFIPIENAIEGTVSASIDGLIFDYDLRIQREVVMDIHLHLMADPKTDLDKVHDVFSYPHALAQCQKFLNQNLPSLDQHATNSTADAAREIRERHELHAAAIASRLAADLYGLSILVEDIEDHPGNQTRFIAISKSGIPAPTGHDRTSIVCFQRNDQPGSLHEILGQFSSRNINLCKLESRPTKQALGDYCFVIDMDGHIADELIADCLRDLHSCLPGVKFLGSYPATGHNSSELRIRASDSWKRADDWVANLRKEIT